MAAEHGTSSRYTQGCRCAECRQARRDYDQERKRKLQAGETDHTHGDPATYKIGCRCEQCSSAHRQWMVEYRQKKLDEAIIVHGGSNAYRIHKCRCDVCREWMRGHARRHWLKRQYGLTEDEHATMLAAQDYRCASCGDEFVDTKSTHTDHNHDTGKVRGILCRDCNLALGYLKEDPDRCAALIRYINKHGDAVDSA